MNPLKFQIWKAKFRDEGTTNFIVKVYFNVNYIRNTADNSEVSEVNEKTEIEFDAVRQVLI